MFSVKCLEVKKIKTDINFLSLIWECALYTGKEEQRARDLFYALWIPDLFMKRVEDNKDWTLMCPHECPGLSDCWGEEFEKLYEKLVYCILPVFHQSSVLVGLWKV